MRIMKIIIFVRILKKNNEKYENVKILMENHENHKKF